MMLIVYRTHPRAKDVYLFEQLKFSKGGPLFQINISDKEDRTPLRNFKSQTISVDPSLTGWNNGKLPHI